MRVSTMLKQSKRSQGGMTLVELMFAAGILAFVLSMVFTSIVTVGMNREIHTERLLADSVVNGILDQISRTDVTQILNFNPRITNLPGNQPQVRIEAITASGTPITLPSSNANVNLPNPLEVRVTLTWRTDRGHTITKRGSVYVSN